MINTIVDNEFLYNMLYELKNSRELSNHIPKIYKKGTPFIILQI